MAQRSRKRQRSSGGAGAASGGLGDTPALGGGGSEADAAREDAAATGRSLPRPAADTLTPAAPPEPRPSRSERTEQRNAEVRAGLEPLAKGERPGAVTVGAAVAAALGALVLIGYATGARVGGEGSLAGALVLAAILFVAAGGMWKVQYWAVLGFEALLAFQIAVAGLSLLVASNWWAALLCVALIGLGGWLFWKLIRAMARIQMPERPTAH
ncbi:hypothetical protein VSS74_08830 [Conexibacter stalactiti]|uniref:DUF4233 domain-containing protein n=1 Tax=Conexibacter stalactiti TaxID=1940611 RepID=A0ABU4HQU7_9ACTN|nr:hypothetical protein [Conexibacter stalactiti]MDW5594439.1 hypothetical protein [Conexibacter stalactiti]MEC5035081.1 hypothetical protein [Conexibacter stalactiti]